MSKVQLKNIWKIFGESPKHVLDTLDQTASRAEIQASTGHVVAVRDVSLDIAEGEIFVVMGLSGSGKSTLIRCINRLEVHQEGEIIVNGITLSEDVKNIDRIRSEVGMCFQQFNLFPHLTVLENCVLVRMCIL